MENLRRLREAAGLTQTQLAERVGVKQCSLSAWEVGITKPSTVNLLKLAYVLECSVDELIGRKPAGA